MAVCKDCKDSEIGTADKIPPEGKLIGVDFGLKRVGLAECDTMRILATPLPAYRTKSMRDTIDYVASVAADKQAVGIVIGLPLNLDGSESVQSGRARALCRNLEKVTGLPAELYDERLTTIEADELLAEAGVKKSDRHNLIDSMAAKVILQGYMDNKNQSRRTIMAENKEKDVELIDEDEVITLFDDEGKPVNFYEVACIEYKDEFYALMQPVEPLEGMDEDEALIFKVREEDEENDVFEPVTDESILDAVFNEYLNAVAEAEGHDCSGCKHYVDNECDCEEKDCAECDDDCGCKHHDCDCCD